MALICVPRRLLSISGSSGLMTERKFLESKVSSKLIEACEAEIGEHRFIRSDETIDWWLEASDEDASYIMLKYF